MDTTLATVRRLALSLLGVMLLTVLAQAARADDIFTCGFSCTGTVTVSGSTYSATGSSAIGNILTNTPGVTSDTFTFSFTLDTAAQTGSAILTDGSDTFTATSVTSVTVSTGSTGKTTDIAFGADWVGSGPNLGGTDATDSGTVVFDVSNGAVTSATIDLIPSDPPAVPEPPSGLLLGAGLLGLGGLGLRKRASLA